MGRLGSLSMAVLMLCFGVLKVWHGHSDRFWLTMEAYYGVVVIELVAGVMAFTRFFRVAAWIGFAIAVSGLVISWFVSGGCGCLGGVEWLEKGLPHTAVTTAFGLLCVWVATIPPPPQFPGKPLDGLSGVARAD